MIVCGIVESSAAWERDGVFKIKFSEKLTSKSSEIIAFHLILKRNRKERGHQKNSSGYTEALINSVFLK